MGRERKESGLAMTEFALCLPFLILVATAVIDIGVAINQYFLLTNAVHAGARAGAALPIMEVGTFSGLTSQQTCTASGSAAFNRQVQQRVEDIVTNYSFFVQPLSMCIQSKVQNVAASGPRPALKNLEVQVTMSYRNFFPLWSSFNLSVKATAPSVS